MKKFLLIITFLGLGLGIFAQDEDSKNDGGRIEALKIAFITKKLNLSTDEAQKFWPIYNKYMDEVRKAQQDAKLNKDPEIQREEKLLNIRKRYNGEFGKAISSEKVNSFFRVEKEFNGVLQKEMMERRQQRLDNRKQRIKQ
jgi:hypothetical protein